MSLESRNFMSSQAKPLAAPEPRPQSQPGKPAGQPHSEDNAHSPGEEFETFQAEKLHKGLVTIEELARKFGPNATEAIVKRSYKISQEEKSVTVGPQYEFPKIPHPLLPGIPQILDAYWRRPRSEQAEQEFLNLLRQLRLDERFRSILDQYEPLMKLYPDRTEEYEAKAMKDFMEMKPGVI